MTASKVTVEVQAWFDECLLEAMESEKMQTWRKNSGKENGWKWRVVKGESLNIQTRIIFIKKKWDAKSLRVGRFPEFFLINSFI